jgi:mRNA interferase RelE/StbE
MYEVVIRKKALKKLYALPEKQQVLISQAIEFLGLDPDDLRLDTKKLIGQPEYRMRIGKWRIIYLRDDIVRIISIEKVGSRGDVYK